MIAYLHKGRNNTWELRFCAEPCNGPAFANAEMVNVSGKREARKICKDRGAQAWNF
jgi:hypothetical protein